jgi:hypothetical protein
MSSKAVIIILLFLILGALFSSLYFLFHDYGKGERTLKALLVRIGFTLTLIVFLLVSIYMGWIRMHPV